jgi:hypothetical protein
MKNYLNYCKLSGLTSNTISSYQNTIKQFLQWCGKQNIVCEVGAGKYAEHLDHRPNIKPSTQLLHLRRINAYLRYTQRNTILIPANLRQRPVNGLTRIRAAFSSKELEKIFYSILSPMYGRRNVIHKVGDAVLLCFMLIGLWNIQVLAEISTSDIDFRLNQLSHPNSNSDVPSLEIKNVNFGYDFIDYLEIWVDNLPPGGMLFPDITQKDIDNLFRRIKKYSGLSMTQAKLKTTSATLLTCSGIPPYLVAKWVGVSTGELDKVVDHQEVEKKFNSIGVISAAFPLISAYQLKKVIDDKE